MQDLAPLTSLNYLFVQRQVRATKAIIFANSIDLINERRECKRV